MAVLRRCLLVLALGALPACTFSSAAVVGAPGEPRAGRSVPVYASDRLDRPYDIIGFISVSDDSSEPDGAVAELRERAGLLGADAVIDVDMRFVQGAWGLATHLSGLAVRYR